MEDFMKKKTQFLLNLALTAIFFILIIFQGPNLNPLYPDGAFSWCFIISCYVVLNFFVALGSVRVGANEYGRCKFSCRMQSRPTSTPYRPLKLLTWSESS